jgi:hypothetical protein
MTALLFIVTVVLFMVAMAAYVRVLRQLGQPASFFDLVSLSRQGNKAAAWALRIWIAAITTAVLAGASMMMKFWM